MPKEYENSIEKMYDVKNSEIILTVEKRWLNEYKKGQISINDLKSRIKNMSKNQYPLKDTYKRISILESIIESKFRNEPDKSVSKNQIDGTHINGLGTVFIIDFNKPYFLGSFSINVDNIFQQALDKSKIALEKSKTKIENIQKDIELKIKNIQKPDVLPSTEKSENLKSSTKKSDQKEEKTTEEKVKELTDEISEIFSDFGSTLKEVKSNERVEILIKSQNLGTKDNKIENVQFTINKSDIDDYEKGVIKIDSFKNRIKIKVF
jgi:hypothetical protein